MSQENQLLLFMEPLEGKLLREVKELKESLDRVRKGQFAKIGSLQKKYDELYADMELIKQGLCHTSIHCKTALHSEPTRTCEILEIPAMYV